MPRPRVRPEDRQRSSKACLPCQTSKIRCDSQSPCMSCARRDRAHACTYIESTSRRRSKRHLRDRPVRFVSRMNPEGATAASPLPARPPRPVANNVNRNDNGQTKPLSGSGFPSRSIVESPECTESRALLSSRGERGTSFILLLYSSPLNAGYSVYWRNLGLIILAVPARYYETIHGTFIVHREWTPEHHARG